MLRRNLIFGCTWFGPKYLRKRRLKGEEYEKKNIKSRIEMNKAGYTATLVACRWAGAVLEKVIRASGQEPYAQKAQKRRKSKKGTDQPTDRRTDIAGCRVA